MGMGMEEDLGLSGNIEKDSKKDEVGKGKDRTKLDDTYQKEKNERKKRKKKKLEATKEKDERKKKLEAVEEKDERKKKKKRKLEAAEEKDGRKKKKKRKLEAAEEKDERKKKRKLEGAEEKDERKKKKKSKLEAAEENNTNVNKNDDDARHTEIVETKKKKKTDVDDRSTAEDGDFSKGNSNKDKKKKKSKKVRFSGQVEIDIDRDKDIVRGKRFSLEEDAKVKEAVLKYIEQHELGEEGVDMVMHCRSHPKIKDCWKEIAKVFPYRPHLSIYQRAHILFILFERGEMRKWTSEEIELVRKHHEEHGPEWQKMATGLGKHRFHVKNMWRWTKLTNRKKGVWSQEEYQTLFDLVNMDLKMKVFEEKKSRHGLLRDNICWGAISDQLSTRSDSVCCRKWYRQLSSSMVNEGEWDNVDNYRLLIALFNLDACCIEDVEWDDLLDNRSGDVCRKRWNQMVHHLGKNEKLSFAERVEILSKRYCPDVLEPREIWDSKPFVD